MKLISKALSLTLLANLLLFSCTIGDDHLKTKAPDSVDQHPAPVLQLDTDDHTTSSNSLVELDFRDWINIEEGANRSDCPALDHATEQQLDAIDSCQYTQSYCDYLIAFWGIHRFIAQIECGLFDCSRCNAVINFVSAGMDNCENYYHPLYCDNLREQILLLEAACANHC